MCIYVCVITKKRQEVDCCVHALVYLYVECTPRRTLKWCVALQASVAISEGGGGPCACASSVTSAFGAVL